MYQKIFLLTLVWVMVLQAVSFSEVRVDKYPEGGVRAKVELNALGFPHGLTQEFYRNGNLQAEKSYEFGLLDGISRLFYEDGTLMTEWVYKSGKRHGLALGYYKNGKLKDKGHYQNDKLVGRVFKYYPNGQLKMQMQFKDDRPDGLAKVYDPKGVLQTQYIYWKGILTRQQSYDAKGNMTLDRTFDRPVTPP